MGVAQIGLYLLLASGLGGMLLPALIIIPAHIIRWPSDLSPKVPANCGLFTRVSKHTIVWKSTIVPKPSLVNAHRPSYG